LSGILKGKESYSRKERDESAVSNIAVDTLNMVKSTKMFNDHEGKVRSLKMRLQIFDQLVEQKCLAHNLSSEGYNSGVLLDMLKGRPEYLRSLDRVTKGIFDDSKYEPEAMRGSEHDAKGGTPWDAKAVAAVIQKAEDFCSNPHDPMFNLEDGGTMSSEEKLQVIDSFIKMELINSHNITNPEYYLQAIKLSADYELLTEVFLSSESEEETEETGWQFDISEETSPLDEQEVMSTETSSNSARTLPNRRKSAQEMKKAWEIHKKGAKSVAPSDEAWLKLASSKIPAEKKLTQVCKNGACHICYLRDKILKIIPSEQFGMMGTHTLLPILKHHPRYAEVRSYVCPLHKKATEPSPFSTDGHAKSHVRTQPLFRPTLKPADTKPAGGGWFS
jgi:hypothetical protein